MSTHEYWIGKGVDYEAVWNDFENGLAYVGKFESMRVHVIRITLSRFPADLPLFNHEAVYKTIKGYFHDLKKSCLTRKEYDDAGPIFLFDVRRDSGVWSFLGELRQLVLFATAIAQQKLMGQELMNMDMQLEFLRKHFGEAVHREDFDRFMQAKTPKELRFALQKLYSQGIEKVEVSTEPFVGNIEKASRSLVTIGGATDGK